MTGLARKIPLKLGKVFKINEPRGKKFDVNELFIEIGCEFSEGQPGLSKREKEWTAISRKKTGGYMRFLIDTH